MQANVKYTKGATNAVTAPGRCCCKCCWDLGRARLRPVHCQLHCHLHPAMAQVLATQVLVCASLQPPVHTHYSPVCACSGAPYHVNIQECATPCVHPCLLANRGPSRSQNLNDSGVLMISSAQQAEWTCEMRDEGNDATSRRQVCAHSRCRVV